MKSGRSLVILIFLGFIWGSGYTIAKLAMLNAVPPLGYAFWQSAGPALLLSISCILKKKDLTRLISYWPYYLICGLLGIAIPNTNMYLIASHMPAGLLAVLVNTVPLFVYPLALFTRQENVDNWRILAIVLGLSGVLMIINPSSTEGLFSYWSLLTLISPLSFALCSIYISMRQPKQVDAIQAASGMLIAATLLLTPLVIQQQAFYALSVPLTLTDGIVLLEILLSSLGYFLFFKLLRLAGPVFYSLTGGVVSLTGLFWGFIVFKELPETKQWLAIICISLGLFLLAWRQSTAVRSSDEEQLRGRLGLGPTAN